MNHERLPMTLTATRRPPDLTLALTCAAPLLVLINYTAPMVTLPQAARALGSGPAGPAWLLNAIALGLAALLLIAGDLADNYGRRRIYLAGMWALAAASVMAALSVNTAMFVTARLVQGAASAGLLTASLGALGHAFPEGRGRLHATGRYGAMLGLGIAVGPLISGGLAAVAGWRAVYWVVAAAAVPLALLGAGLLPESRAAERRPLDLPGVLLLASGLAALVTAVTEGRGGWSQPVVAVAAAAAALLLGSFAVVERRRPVPLLDLGLFRRPLFAVATGGALVVGMVVIGLMSFLPTVLQLARGLSPLGSAALFAVWSGTSFLTALQARRLPLAGRGRLALGLLLSAAGTLPLLDVAGHAPWVRIVLGLAVAGIGSGLINASLTHLAIESVPPHRAGMGSGANNTARYVGSPLGVALMAAVVGTAGLSAGTDGALVVCAVVAAAAGGGVLLLSRPAGR
ncbi:MULTISPECIES: MFS transporter [Streptosporangium]|uniref:MFS family permease n=1 Tax=Streptosporangium brasiliense TaxID=47480 RepID=A0ABT9RF64_9ACTN|nr:MFS transporter [Streptosporangium brasiliense]MDP9867010.1 MFS family permease [Streptosporangium brasiliense]